MAQRSLFANQVVLIPLFSSCACFVNSDATGSFPDYPDEEDGGSALILAEKNPQQVKHTLSQHSLLHILSVVCRRRTLFGGHLFFQLKEEIAAKEEEDSNNKPKGKEEKKEKGKKNKGKDEEEVSSYSCIELILFTQYN